MINNKCTLEPDIIPLKSQTVSPKGIEAEPHASTADSALQGFNVQSNVQEEVAPAVSDDAPAKKRGGRASKKRSSGALEQSADATTETSNATQLAMETGPGKRVRRYVLLHVCVASC